MIEDYGVLVPFHTSYFPDDYQWEIRELKKITLTLIFIYSVFFLLKFDFSMKVKYLQEDLLQM